MREQFSGAFDVVENRNRPLPQVSVTAFICQLYQNALLTFRNSQIEIISGIFYKIFIFFRIMSRRQNFITFMEFCK